MQKQSVSLGSRRVTEKGGRTFGTRTDHPLLHVQPEDSLVVVVHCGIQSLLLAPLFAHFQQMELHPKPAEQINFICSTKQQKLAVSFGSLQFFRKQGNSTPSKNVA